MSKSKVGAEGGATVAEGGDEEGEVGRIRGEGRGKGGSFAWQTTRPGTRERKEKEKEKRGGYEGGRWDNAQKGSGPSAFLMCYGVWWVVVLMMPGW